MAVGQCFAEEVADGKCFDEVVVAYCFGEVAVCKCLAMWPLVNVWRCGQWQMLGEVAVGKCFGQNGFGILGSCWQARTQRQQPCSLKLQARM